MCKNTYQMSCLGSLLLYPAVYIRVLRGARKQKYQFTFQIAFLLHIATVYPGDVISFLYLCFYLCDFIFFQYIIVQEFKKVLGS